MKTPATQPYWRVSFLKAIVACESSLPHLQAWQTRIRTCSHRKPIAFCAMEPTSQNIGPCPNRSLIFTYSQEVRRSQDSRHCHQQGNMLQRSACWTYDPSSVATYRILEYTYDTMLVLCPLRYLTRQSVPPCDQNSYE
jgi:hypothetical protein